MGDLCVCHVLGAFCITGAGEGGADANNGVEVPELGIEREAAVVAKMWSQNGIASSRSLPSPLSVFFWLTAMCRVA